MDETNKLSKMKNKYTKFPFFPFSIIILLLSFTCHLSAQPFTFTTAGATGASGPTQGQINSAYAGTALANQVTSVNGIQQWNVPSSGLYLIEVFGAQGGGNSGGLGAHMQGEFTLQGNDLLEILVGQEGVTNDNGNGGGGGSFVILSGQPLIVAGGGGGNNGTANSNSNANSGQNGNTGMGANGSGSGGANGQPGQSTQRAQGGSGWLGDGPVFTQNTSDTPARSFNNGGEGGQHNTSAGGVGGFGGGGGSWNTGWRGSGGGGGYSGGGGGHQNSNPGVHYGGGGGSFNSGNNPVNQGGVNSGDGLVIITPMSPGAPNDAGISSIDSPSGKTCAGNQPVTVTITNYGSEILNTVTVNWEVGGQLQPPVTYNNPIDTLNGQNPNTAQLSLGSFNFQNLPDTTIRAWTSMPNGVQDTVPFNDTAVANVDINFAVVQVISSQPPTCPDVADGQAIVTSLGGTPPFEFFWSSGDTGTNVSSLPSGNIEVVIIDALGCRDTAVLDLQAPDSINIELDRGGTTCGGATNGFAHLNITGGTPPYDFNWSNGLRGANINNVPPGQYSVTVTDDDGCSQSRTIDIIQVPILRSEVDSVTPANCSENAGTASVSGSGGLAPLSYLWPGGLTGRSQTGLPGGHYQVTVVDDAGCENITNVKVPEVDLSVAFERPTLMANLDNAVYQWYDCDNETLVSGEMSQDFTPTQPGNYAVIITYENCTDTSGCHFVAYTSAYDQTAENNEVKIYPNPNSGQFNISFDGGSGTSKIEIFDINGRLLQSREVQTQGGNYVHQVNENLSAGVYIIKVLHNDQASLHRMVVK